MTRHHPNHEHDDLRQPRRTDATPQPEADALDALLNEIAHNPGPPATRSAAGPNDRIPPSANESLDASARAFHRRHAAAEARDPGASGLDPTLWEQIMITASPAAPTSATVSSGNPWTTETPSPTRKRHATASRRWVPTRTWTGIANATLALLIIAAAFATWQVYDRVNHPGGSDAPPTGTVPGLAMQPGTPEETAPVATPTPAYACNFSQDIPIFQQVDESPIEGTALLVTTDGELVLTCPEEPEPIVLAGDVAFAWPQTWPGTLSTTAPNDSDASSDVTVVNVFLGKSVVVNGAVSGAMWYGWRQPDGTPWMIAPTGETANDWEITDLRTMESRSYESLSGTPLPDGVALESPYDMQSTGSIMVMPWAKESMEDTGTIPQGKGSDARALLINGTFDNVHTFTLPTDLPRVASTSLAPDGKHLALETTEDGELPAGNVMYVVISTAQGREVGRSESFEDPESDMRWVQDGASLAYTQEDQLMLLSIADGSSPVSIFAPNQALTELSTTDDPNVVLVTRLAQADYATEAAGGISQFVYSVNVETGESQEVEGFNVSHNSSPFYPDTQFLVMADSSLHSPNMPQSMTYRVVDAVTGEQVGELPDVPVSPDLTGSSGVLMESTTSTTDGSVLIVGFGADQLYLIRDTGGTPQIRRLSAPGPIAEAYNGGVHVELSSDGSMVSVSIINDESRTRWLLALDEPDAEWLEVPTVNTEGDPGFIFFVPGTGD